MHESIVFGTMPNKIKIEFVRKKLQNSHAALSTMWIGWVCIMYEWNKMIGMNRVHMESILT
jgi:hypothetical protein